MTDTIAYIGTYTRSEPHVQGQAEGVYVYRLDHATGALHHLSTVGGVVNPSFVTVDAQRRYLYAVHEIEVFEGQSGGAVSAFAIDADTHALTLLNHQPTHGAHPCYVSVDSTGRWLLVANYGGGSISVLPINDDGSLGAATAVVQHTEKPTHHDGPHPHSIMSAPGDGGYVVVPDCGLDRIYVYRLDTANGTLTPNDPSWTMLQPGAGPRHLAFDASGRYVYCINERNSTATVLAYDASNGTLKELQTLSTLPDTFTGRNSCADIHIAPNGRYVYGSNRGDDSIAVFAIDSASKELISISHTSTGGRTPRNFGIDPTGTWLLAANQDSGTIVTFRIDQTTGELTSMGQIAAVPSPVCICFVSEEKR